jgi:hypothetical protein
MVAEEKRMNECLIKMNRRQPGESALDAEAHRNTWRCGAGRSDTMPSIEQATASIQPLAGAAALLPADVPTFRWRARVNVAGGQPAGTRAFKIGIDAMPGRLRYP